MEKIDIKTIHDINSVNYGIHLSSSVEDVLVFLFNLKPPKNALCLSLLIPKEKKLSLNFQLIILFSIMLRIIVMVRQSHPSEN